MSDSDNEEHQKDGFSSIQEENEAHIEVQDESDVSEVFKNENEEERNKMEVEGRSEQDTWSDSESQDKNPDVKQQKKKCPLPYCNSAVRHLPRHLRNVHNWSKQVAKTAMCRFKLRKQYTFSSQETASAGNRKPRKTECDSKPKNYKKPCRKKTVCPIPGRTTVTSQCKSESSQQDLEDNDPDNLQKSDPNVPSSGGVVRPGSSVDTEEPSSVVQETLKTRTSTRI